MADREIPSQKLDEFERDLSAMTPRPQTLDRAALFFQAGKESSRADRRRWQNRLRCWQAAAAAMTLLALGLSWQAWNDQPQIVERIRPEPAPAVVDEFRFASPLAARPQRQNRKHYLQQRFVALTRGFDELDRPLPAGQFDEFDNRRYRDLMDQYLEF